MTRTRNTEVKLNELMDKLAVYMVEQVTLTKNKDNFELKLDVMKTVTNYMSMKNRSPEEPEGADILDFRKRLTRPSAGGGDDTGERDPDAVADGDGGEGDPEGDEGAGDAAGPNAGDTRAA